MPRGNRLLFIALGLVALVTTLIGVWTYPYSPTTQHFRYDNPRNESYRPGGGQCEPAKLAAITDTKVRLSKADDCEKQAEEYRQASDDLIQQTRAANAAQAQASIASQQLWTGWLQTLGGFLTLAAAVGAAVYARDAASHTRQANEIALSVQRAWVVVGAEAQLTRRERNGIYFRFNVISENVGQTPANHFGMRADIVFEHEGEPPEAVRRRAEDIVESGRLATKVPASVILAPGEKEVGQHWQAKFPPELSEHVILDDTPVTHAVFVVANYYRTVTEPDVLQVAWRMWLLGSIENSGEALSTLRIDKDFKASQLHLMPMSGMNHKEYPDAQKEV